MKLESLPCSLLKSNSPYSREQFWATAWQSASLELLWSLTGTNRTRWTLLAADPTFNQEEGDLSTILNPVPRFPTMLLLPEGCWIGVEHSCFQWTESLQQDNWGLKRDSWLLRNQTDIVLYYGLIWSGHQEICLGKWGKEWYISAGCKTESCEDLSLEHKTETWKQQAFSLYSSLWTLTAPPSKTTGSRDKSDCFASGANQQSELEPRPVIPCGI